MSEAITDGNRVIEELAERLTGRYPWRGCGEPQDRRAAGQPGGDDDLQDAQSEIVGAGIYQA